jgi:hypothetical protein
MILFQQRRAPIMLSDLPLPRYVLLGSQHHITSYESATTHAPDPPPPTDPHHKNKDKEKEDQKQKTDEPTRRPTRTPRSPIPTDAPVQTTQTKGSSNQGNEDVLMFEAAESSPLIFEPVDTSTTLNVAAAAATTTTNTASSTTESNTTGESSTTTTIYKPFRVQFDTRQLAQQMDLAISAGDAIAATKLYLLIYEILPMTAQFWGDILRLIPVTGGIYPLAAQGSGVDHLLSNGQSNENALSPILPGVVFSLRE